MSFGKYNLLQLNGDIFNLKTNLSVFIKNSSGILFYAIDLDYKFLIETVATNKMQHVSVMYKRNNWNFIMYLTHSCERTIYGDVYMKFYFHLQQSQFFIGCNQTLSRLKFERNEKIEHLKHFPSPLNSSNTIDIWIGNIGPYKGKGNRIYKSLKIQLKGCVDIFFFDHKNISLKNKGFLFLLNCRIKYIEKIYGINNFNKKNLYYKMYDCDITSMNGRYCNNTIDYRNFSFKNSSYIRTTFKESNFFLRLDWKNSQLLYKNSYCLMEIGLRDNSLILFYVNENNVLIESEMKTNSINYMETFLINIKSNTNNILLIHNDKLILTMKIYDGEIIHTYTHSIKSEIIFVNIGHFKHNNSIPWFMGNIKFQYNKSIWANSLYFNETITTPNLESIGGKLTLPSIILVFAIFLIILTLVGIYTFSKRRIKSNSDVTFKTTRSKTPSPNHYEYELTVNPFEEKGNVGMLVNEEINNTTDDVYEKIS